MVARPAARSGGVLAAVLRPRIQEEPSGRIVSLRLYSSSLLGRANEGKDRPPFGDKKRDVQPPSFDFAQCSKEGDRDVAPPPSFEFTQRSKEGDGDVASPVG